jgi:hypothetical protein
MWLSIELTLLPSMNIQFHMGSQRIQTARKTTGATHQPGQIVTKLGVARLDAVGLALIGTRFMNCLVVMQFELAVILVAEVVPGRRFTDPILSDPLVTGGDNTPAQKAATGAVNNGHDVDSVFLCPTKVNSSSCSAVDTGVSGLAGSSGNCAA